MGTDSGVEGGLRDVHGHVENDEQGAVNDDHPAEEEAVAVEDGVDEEASGPGDVEEGFDDDGACEQVGCQRAQEGYDGKDGDAQGMAVEDDALGEAFGAGGADEILTEHLEHASSEESGDGGDVRGGEGGGGQDKGFGRAPAADGQPFEPDAEDEDEEGAEHEGGQGDKCEGEQHGEGVFKGAVCGRCGDSQGDAEAGGEEECGDAEGHGYRQGLREDFGHCAVAVFGGEAEVATQEVGEVSAVLLPE